MRVHDHAHAEKRPAHHLQHLCSAIGDISLIECAHEGTVQEYRQWRAVRAQLVLLLVKIYSSLDAHRRIYSCHQRCWHLHSVPGRCTQHLQDVELAQAFANCCTYEQVAVHTYGAQDADGVGARVHAAGLCVTR